MNDLEEVMLLDIAIKEANIKLEKARTKNAKRTNESPADLTAIESYIDALKSARETALFTAASTIANTSTPTNW